MVSGFVLLLILVVVQFVAVYKLSQMDGWLILMISCNILCIIIFGGQVFDIYGHQTTVSDVPYIICLLSQYIIFGKYGYEYTRDLMTRFIVFLSLFFVTSHLMVAHEALAEWWSTYSLNKEIIKSIDKNIHIAFMVYIITQYIVIISANSLKARLDSVFLKVLISVTIAQTIGSFIYLITVYNEKAFEFVFTGLVIKFIVTIIGAAMISHMAAIGKIPQFKDTINKETNVQQ